VDGNKGGVEMIPDGSVSLVDAPEKLRREPDVIMEALVREYLKIARGHTANPNASRS
jgi:hypothetical protein